MHLLFKKSSKSFKIALHWQEQKDDIAVITCAKESFDFYSFQNSRCVI